MILGATRASHAQAALAASDASLVVSAIALQSWLGSYLKRAIWPASLATHLRLASALRSGSASQPTHQ